MRRPWFIPLAVAALVAALAWLASGQLSTSSNLRGDVLSLAATVRAEEVSVLAPSLAASAPVAARGAGGSAPAVAGALASLETSLGTHVESGQVIARLDSAALKLQLTRARAASRASWARVGVVDANLDTVEENATTLADARAKLDDTLAGLRASRAEVAANLAKARKAVESLPPTLPPVLPPGMTDPRPLVPKLEAALAKLDAGIAKATAARAKLDSGDARVADARSQLEAARPLAVLAAKAVHAGIDVAAARVALAAVRAPSAGVVTWLAERGSVLYVGGPVARIVPDSAPVLDTYLSADEAPLVSVGASAKASTDSFPGRTFGGRVTGLRPVYEYPPTSLPTRLIHMARAFKVTVTIDDTAAPLPGGTPADLTISVDSRKS